MFSSCSYYSSYHFYSLSDPPPPSTLPSHHTFRYTFRLFFLQQGIFFTIYYNFVLRMYPDFMPHQSRTYISFSLLHWFVQLLFSSPLSIHSHLHYYCTHTSAHIQVFLLVPVCSFSSSSFIYLLPASPLPTLIDFLSSCLHRRVLRHQPCYSFSFVFPLSVLPFFYQSFHYNLFLPSLSHSCLFHASLLLYSSLFFLHLSKYI